MIVMMDGYLKTKLYQSLYRYVIKFQVVAYLFAQKLLAPTKFFLIRGNHEIRETQKLFTFYK